MVIQLRFNVAADTGLLLPALSTDAAVGDASSVGGSRWVIVRAGLF